MSGPPEHAADGAADTPVGTPDQPLEPALRDRRFRWALLFVLLLALAVRWGTTAAVYSDLDLEFTDNYWYHAQANGLIDGQGFTNPFGEIDGISEPSARSPLYTVYLAGFSLIGLDGEDHHRYASGLADAFTAVFAALIARRLAAPRWALMAGVVAGSIAAFSPSLWANDGLILSESLYAPLLTGAILAGICWWQEPTVRRAATFGLVLGLAALARTEASALAVLLVGWMMLVCRRGGELRDRLRCAGACALMAAVVTGPWIVRNLVTFEEPTLLSGGLGYVMDGADCPEAWEGQFKGYWYWDCLHDDAIVGDESVIDAELRSRGFEYLTDNAGDAPGVMFARVGRLYGFFRPGQTMDFDNLFERRGQRPAEAAMITFWAMCPFAVIGAVALRRRGWTIAPLVATFALVTVTVALTFGISRYRLAIDALLPVYAAMGVVVVLARLGLRPPRWLAPTAPSPLDLTSPEDELSAPDAAVGASQGESSPGT